MNNKALVAGLILLLLVHGCTAQSGYWSFPLMGNTLFGKAGVPSKASRPSSSGGPGLDLSGLEGAHPGILLIIPLFIIGAIVLVPIVVFAVGLGIDVALLPITGPHDLLIWSLKQNQLEPKWGTGERYDIEPEDEKETRKESVSEESRDKHE
ncbi:MAG: hypothetical protein ACYTFG_13025 [Planctomycetota bacterium]|jgi:hypothetical protein